MILHNSFCNCWLFFNVYIKQWNEVDRRQLRFHIDGVVFFMSLNYEKIIKLQGKNLSDDSSVKTAHDSNSNIKKRRVNIIFWILFHCKFEFYE